MTGSDFDRTYLALSYGFRVRTSLPRIGELVDRYLAPFRHAVQDVPAYSLVESSEGQRYALLLDDQRLEEAATLAGLIDLVLWEAHRQAVRSTTDRLTIHAGAVSWGDQGMLLPAKMDSGKTTTTAGLVRAGFDYFTDESAVVDPETGTLYPFPKALSLEPPSMEILPELKDTLPPEFPWGTRLRYHIRAEDLRPDSIGSPCQVRWVVSPRYEPAGETSLVPMSRAETAYLLAENSFNFHDFGGRGLHVVGLVAERAQGYRLWVGDLDSAVRAVRDLVTAGASA